MNKSIPFRTNVASAILCLALFASCSADNEPDNALPEGKYPMTFTTAMEGLTQTRATPDGTWAGGEKIAVQVGDKVKQYTATIGGASTKLTGVDAANTFYWYTANEQKTVSAWYSGNPSYVISSDIKLPTSFTVKSDQSREGYQQSDFLYANPQSIAYSSRDQSSLIFKHLPAKVIINLKNGDGLTAEDVKNATVRIVNQATTSGAIEAAGTVAQITNAGSEEIIPNVENTTSTDWQKSVKALLVPQQISGEPFIKVTIVKDNNERDYYYTPSEGKVDFLSGVEYTYTITVTKTGLKVEPVSIGEWTDNSISSGTVDKAKFHVKFTAGPLPDNFILTGIKLITGNVYEITDDTSFSFSYTTSNPAEVPVFSMKGMATGMWEEISNDDNTTTYTYTCTNIRSDLWINRLAVGCYYYADGTWSSEYTDIGPACIGIVFWVGDATVKDAKLKRDHPDCTHGLVVALNDVKDGTTDIWRWQSTNIYVQDWLVKQGLKYLSVASDTNSADPLNNIQGYNNTKAIEEFNAVNTSLDRGVVQAVAMATEYRNATPAPAKSSMWYLPSAKELSLLYGKDVNDIYNTHQETAENRDLINGKLSSISGATPILSAGYWSSTEYSGSNSKYFAFYVGFDNGRVYRIGKSYTYRVRCVLAF